MKIIIIDYGMGNLKSVQNHLIRLGYPAIISSNRNDILSADKLILPGVGHFAEGMKKLKEYDLIESMNKKVLEDRCPILGICLGMQLFTEFSEEGNTNGLGWIKAKTKKFVFAGIQKELKIPHMGWNTINFRFKSNLFMDIPDDSSFYFVHSYYVECGHEEDILAETEYGIKFTSVIGRDNIFGTQFHPEKSHQAGIQLLKNFIELNRDV